jgi:hypothetical protein
MTDGGCCSKIAKILQPDNDNDNANDNGNPTAQACDKPRGTSICHVGFVRTGTNSAVDNQLCSLSYTHYTHDPRAVFSYLSKYVSKE